MSDGKDLKQLRFCRTPVPFLFKASPDVPPKENGIPPASAGRSRTASNGPAGSYFGDHLKQLFCDKKTKSCNGSDQADPQNFFLSAVEKRSADVHKDMESKLGQDSPLIVHFKLMFKANKKPVLPGKISFQATKMPPLSQKQPARKTSFRLRIAPQRGLLVSPLTFRMSYSELFEAKNSVTVPARSFFSVGHGNCQFLPS